MLDSLGSGELYDPRSCAPASSPMPHSLCRKTWASLFFVVGRYSLDTSTRLDVKLLTKLVLSQNGYVRTYIPNPCVSLPKMTTPLKALTTIITTVLVVTKNADARSDEWCECL